jgi:predicted transcriptional regulator
MPTLVRDLMSRDVTVIRRDCDVHELEKLLLAKRIHGVPVVDEADRMVGVVSQTDLLAWHFEVGVDGSPADDAIASPLGAHEGGALHLSDIRVARVDEIMSPVVHVIGPDRTIAEAAECMTCYTIHRLVVVDSSLRILGLLSALDILRAVPVAAPSALPEAAPPRRRATSPPTLHGGLRRSP